MNESKLYQNTSDRTPFEYYAHHATHTLYSQIPDVIVCEAPVGRGDHSEVPFCVERPVHLIMPILLTFALDARRDTLLVNNIIIVLCE